MVKNLSNKSLLITGGTGYLGASIGQYLCKYGYNVFLGSRNPFSNGVIEGCDQVATDWDDPELKFCNGFDLIIHAAGMNAEACAENPTMAVRFNGETTARFAEKAAFYGCCRFIYLSTVHVYKAPLIGIFNEQSPTLNEHPYAISQLFGEQAVLNVLDNFPLGGAVLRLSNCFGPPASNNDECWRLALNQFVRDAMTLGCITIKGDFSTRRDFLSISELNNVLSKVIGVSKLKGEILNISSGQSRSLLDVALLVSSTVRNRTGRDIEIKKNHYSLPKADLVLKNDVLSSMGIFVDRDLVPEIESLVSYLQKYS